jgi:hypothetical protein
MRDAAPARAPIFAEHFRSAMSTKPESAITPDGAASAHCAEAAGSAPSDAQIERVARAISRAYIQGFRHAHPHITQWITTLDEAVDLQWEVVSQEALEALLPNTLLGQTADDKKTQ